MRLGVFSDKPGVVTSNTLITLSYWHAHLLLLIDIGVAMVLTHKQKVPK